MPEYVFDCIDNPDLTKLAGLIYENTNLQLIRGKTETSSGEVELDGSDGYMQYDGSLHIFTNSDLSDDTLRTISDIVSSFTYQAHKEV